MTARSRPVLPVDGLVDAPAEPVTTGRLRQALGRFVSGVIVVTTAEPDGRDVHGMTANAFSSVSLRPPLVLVSVANEAHLQARIHRTGRYGVSVLGAGQAALAEHFAGRRPNAEPVSFHWRDGLPLLEPALARLTCTVVESVPAGDHTIHLGRVDTIDEQDGTPLVFHRGQLAGLTTFPTTRQG